ncbi:thaumatin [Gilbertella persicaria]|uniref:thaumatin n=1 Tax=Gilbertella persicaria TaxID=101096 RepID=UPI0022210D26|nr:thaumatin [Gilbertella persicaria]KAI8055603.1 thaumatin [Gilbertella persicaria]
MLFQMSMYIKWQHLNRTKSSLFSFLFIYTPLLYNMVKFVTLLAALAGMSASVMAAPTSGTNAGVTITVKNSCSKSIQVNQLTNDASDQKATSLAAGSSTQINVPSNWGGRIWAREGCSGSSDCNPGAPASLAELLFKGAAGKDYYDVSFVDGYNLPISISPNSGKADGYECGVPACSSLPDCPSELQDKDSNGNVIGCKSACAAFGTGEYCCTGDASERGKCAASKYSIPVKESCPDVYTYAYDDSTSMFSCSSSGYNLDKKYEG